MKGRAPLPGSGPAAARRWGRKVAGKAALAGSTALAALLLAGPVRAQDADPANLFGSRGIISTPSARMAQDGELSVGASFFKNNQHYNFGFEVLPWLEATFRYSGLQHFQKEYPVYYDRAFGIKARLWDEDRNGLMPAVAVGIDDIIGTGVYNGEYVVASKRFGAIDTSLGMGWGRHAGTGELRNPIALVINSFNERQSFFGQAGGADFKAFFHGRKVGVFGGAVWHTPLDGLSVMAEYDSDNYAQERSFGNFTPRSQVNYGVNYAVSDRALLGLYWLYGRVVGGSFSLRMDPVHPQYPVKLGDPPPPVVERTPEQQHAALVSLLGQRDPNMAVQTRLMDTRNADRNDFVDALWRQSSDIADIQVRQSMLDMTVTGAVSQPRCAAVARLMQGVSTHISRVRLQGTGGKRGVSCDVPRTVEAAPISAAFLTDLKVLPLPVVQTIDASDVVPVPNRAQTLRAIKKAIIAQQIVVEALSYGNGELVVYYRNNHYFAETDAVDRMVRVLTKEAPADIEKFRLIPVYGGLPQKEFDVLRAPVERSASQNEGAIFDHAVSLSLAPMDNPVLEAAAKASYPRFTWGLYPQMRQALFDPNQPFGIQLLAAASAALEVAPGLSFSGSVEASLYDDFDTSRASDSTLPHVRSDFLKYFKAGKTGIGHLEGDYRFRLTPTVYVSARAGYLESMFGGAGGEILWRPENARWALGADLYQVWQRDFDRLLGLQHYHVTTGHISLYYDSPWYNLNFQLRAGQYLAGDRGFTFQMTRRFSTGVEIGAFVTKTNISAAQFGEGSFDKGIIIRVPLGWIAPLETQSQIAIDLRPVQRDGGQSLNGDATLYEETRATSEGELLRQQPGLNWN